MIYQSTMDDKRKVMDTLLLGLSMDPIILWYFPNPHDFLADAPGLLELISGKAFEHNTAYHTDDYTCCAFWLPPNIHPDDDDIKTYLKERLSRSLFEDVSRLETELAHSIPKEACWHLACIAADPNQTGKGYGSQLLTHTLNLCDEDNEPAYLESTNRANLSLYQRHGFELSGEIQVGSSPTVYTMLRQPK